MKCINNIPNILVSYIHEKVLIFHCIRLIAMTVGRPRKWSGYYKRLEIRIPKEYSYIVDTLEMISSMMDKSINEIVLDSLISYIDLDNNLDTNRNSIELDIKKNAKILCLKLQIKDAYINYVNELKIISNKSKSINKDPWELYTNYRYLQQYRTTALKLISQLPEIDDEIKRIYDNLVELPNEVKEVCRRLEE